MTEQEAIKNALNGLKNADIKIDDEIRYPSIKALEKQIPKKPNDVRLHVDHKTGYCPLCNTKLAHFGDMNYCHKCGIKLDWSCEDAE